MAKKETRTREPIETIATRIIRKSGAYLQNDHYKTWLVRELTEMVNDSALLEIVKNEHVNALEEDRDQIWNALVTLAGGPDEAKQLIGE